MVQSSSNERLTAFVSTVVAVAILAAGVTAQQSSSPKATNVVQLGSDLRFQFEMGFRHNTRERDARLAQLDAAMADWQASTQSDADRAALVTWLRAAGENSLPGALSNLPERPKFSRVQPPTEHKVMKAMATEAIASAAAVSATPKLPAVTAEAVTPTASDPLEEEMIALRQPQTLTAGAREQPVSNTLAVAPRPGVQEQPKLVEENLLASVSISNEGDAEEPIGVNLTELAARIAGYHDSLDEVETALLRLETASLDVVALQIQRLDSMTRDYSFVRLYYESLTDAERKTVLAPREMKSTLAEVERQLTRCEEVLDGDFLGSFDEAAEAEIAALRAKLAAIVERVER